MTAHGMKNGVMRSPVRATTTRVLDCPEGIEYGEEVFRYFLAVEQARAARAGHTLRLVLASVEQALDQPMALTAGDAAGLFAGLREGLRETDVVGWYRQELVAAGTVIVPEPMQAQHVSVVERRVSVAMKRLLRPALFSRLRLRIVPAAPMSQVRGLRSAS
jgi:hypothetical protein